MMSRRKFLNRSAAAMAAAGLPGGGFAAAAPLGPLGRPIGLQLYTVRQAAEADLEGTLRAVAAIGYRDVELAGLYGRDAATVHKLLTDNGLRAPAAHYNMFALQDSLDDKLADMNTLGVEYLVCSFPGLADPGRFRERPGGPAAAIVRGELTLDDWRWNAEQLERIAVAAGEAGLRFAYHNHAMEFRHYGGAVAYDELLRLTDPERVFLEVDCAWVAAAGHDPARFIETHEDRVRLLHIKDVAAGDEFATTEVGQGILDWSAIFDAVNDATLAYYFVEQEHFEQAPLDAIKVSFDYLAGLGGR